MEAGVTRSYNHRVADSPAVQVLELAHAAPSDRVRGNFRVEQATSTLELVGWALGLDSPVVQVEVVLSGQVVGQAAPREERPDIAETFPGVAGAGTSGFRIALEPHGRGRSQLRIQAALEDGGWAPLGDLRVEATR